MKAAGGDAWEWAGGVFLLRDTGIACKPTALQVGPLMALFSLLDVNLCFGGPAVLDKVNFQVDPGERLCLVGRNGAGKSTLMKTIAGEIKPDTGAVFRQPGALFTRLTQEVPTDIVGSVTDIVTSGLRPQTEHEEDWERDVRVDNLIEKLQLAPSASFTALSGGLKRRVLLARALAGQPDLLLLDEPTNHLDISAQLSTLGLLSSVAGSGTTVLAALHDLNLAAAWCDSVIVMSRGRVVAAGRMDATLTPALIRNVYGVDAALLEHPVTGRPVIAFSPPAS